MICLYDFKESLKYELYDHYDKIINYKQDEKIILNDDYYHTILKQ